MVGRAKKGTKATEAADVQDIGIDFKKALGKGFFLRFMAGSLGIRRKVDKKKLEGLTDAERKLLSVTKKTLDCDEYLETQRIYAKMVGLLSIRSVPVLSDMMKSCYLIPMEVWSKTWAELTTLRGEFEKACDTFAFKAYSKAKAEAKEALGKFYDER